MNGTGCLFRILWIAFISVYTSTTTITGFFITTKTITPKKNHLPFSFIQPKSQPSTPTTSTSNTARMGIRGFRSWFESQFPNAVQEIPVVLHGKDNRKQSQPQEAQDHKQKKSKKQGGKKTTTTTTTNANTTTTTTTTSTAEEFDHVLIDMNQVLHTVMRKSRSDSHCMILLYQELDTLIHNIATPTQSLVLVMDGPPGAAKLATQRKRRMQLYGKSQRILQYLDRLIRNNTTHSSDSSRKKSQQSNAASQKKKKKLKQFQRKKRRVVSDLRTLSLTPGTEFMEYCERAILYYAWQRLLERHHSSKLRNVKIFVSPSIVPGEGEVKLLEWIYHKPSRRNQSIAIIGGDSDLVLESLIIPISITHNVFVILPDGRDKYLCVSLWETTKSLISQHATPLTTTIPPKERKNEIVTTTTAAAASNDGSSLAGSLSEVIFMRTDLVLLLILNGNDYLPKLRGCGGFHKLFVTYRRVREEFGPGGYLVHPDTLEFNLDFAIAFFGRLAQHQPPNLFASSPNNINNNGDETSSILDKSSSPLHRLHNLVAAEFLPGPLQFVVFDDDETNDGFGVENGYAVSTLEEDYVSSNDREDSSEFDDDGDDDDDVDEEEIDDDDLSVNKNHVRVRLLIGEPGSDDFYTYEIHHPRVKNMSKKARQKLAAMALEDLMDEQQEEGIREYEDDLDNVGASHLVEPAYDWEIRRAVEGKVDRYLYGLLWNLQTYQDGVSADYNFNYGKRMSPLSSEIKDFFVEARSTNKTLGPKELRSSPFSPSVSAGLSCLAALPSSARNLVPEPYRSLNPEIVEEFYARCMDASDNAFDLKLFESLCEEQIAALNLNDAQDASRSIGNDGRKIRLIDHYWTVISRVPKTLPRPFDPPEPFSDRLSRLPADNRIRVSRYMATSTPRPRQNDEISNLFENPPTSSRFVDKASHGFSHTDPGPLLSKLASFEQIDYKIAYQRKKEQHRGLRKKGQVKMDIIVRKDKTSSKTVEQDLVQNSSMPRNEKTISATADPGIVQNSSRRKEKISPNTNAARLNGKQVENSNGAQEDRHTFYVGMSPAKFVANKNESLQNRYQVGIQTPEPSKGMHKNGSCLHESKVDFPLSEPSTNSEGSSALSILKQLSDRGIIGDVIWEVTLVPDSFDDARNNLDHELIRLSVAKGSNPEKNALHENLKYEQLRHVHNGMSKKSIKQSLASFALCDITGPTVCWSNLTYKQLTEFLSNEKVEG